jgi:hypothetical protein
MGRFIGHLFPLIACSYFYIFVKKSEPCPKAGKNKSMFSRTVKKLTNLSLGYVI